MSHRQVTCGWTWVDAALNVDAGNNDEFVASLLPDSIGVFDYAYPGGVVLTRVDATHWTITLTGSEFVQVEYKFTLGAWEYVEKDGACGEVANRQLTLSYGSTGMQSVNDAVLNWRNVAPCGN